MMHGERIYHVTRDASGTPVIWRDQGPLTRCRDCRHRTERAGQPACSVNRAFHFVTRLDGFCHRAEPRKDGHGRD